MDDIDFSYDGNDEEAKRIATEPKKPMKVIPVKKKEPKPIILPNKPVEVATPPTPVEGISIPPEETKTQSSEIKTIAKIEVPVPKVKQEQGISAPAVVIATVATAVSLSVASSMSKGKGKGSNNKTNNRNDRNNNKEEKKKEEQKACDSKSDAVQSLIEETDKVIDSINSRKPVEYDNKSFDKKVLLLNTELIKLKSDLTKLEERISKAKNKRLPKGSKNS